MKNIWPAGALVLVLAAGVVGWNQFGRAASQSTVLQTAESGVNDATALTFTDIGGKWISVNPDEKTVLHFMTSSCSDCLPTETMLTKFQRLPGVQLISIDVEPQTDNGDTIAWFSHVAGSHWPYVPDTISALVGRFHVTELDTVVVLYHNRVIFDSVVPSAAQLQKVLA